MVCPYIEDEGNACPYGTARQLVCRVGWWLSLRNSLFKQPEIRCGDCIRRRLRYLEDWLRPSETNREVSR